MFTAGQPRVDQIGEKLGKLNLEKPCKDMCKRIRGTSRSKIPRTQKIEGPIKIRSGGKRRFGRMHRVYFPKIFPGVISGWITEGSIYCSLV